MKTLYRLFGVLLALNAYGSESIKIGLCSNVTTTITRKEYVTGTNLLIQEILKNEKIETETTTYENNIALSQDFINGSIDMIVCDPLTIVDNIPNRYLETGITGYKTQKSDAQTLLLLSLSEDHRPLSEKLQGQIASEGDPVAMLYLKTLMLEENMDTQPLFYFTKNVQQSILKLFFHKTDLALVDRGAFLTATELNPQLKTQITVVKTVPITIGSVSFMRKSLPADFRSRIIRAAHAINDTQKGKQLLGLMHAKMIDECSPDELESIYALKKHYKTLLSLKSKKGKQS